MLLITKNIVLNFPKDDQKARINKKVFYFFEFIKSLNTMDAINLIQEKNKIIKQMKFKIILIL